MKKITFHVHNQTDNSCNNQVFLELDYIHVGTKKIGDECVCKLLHQLMIMCINYQKDYKHVFNQVKETHFHNKENVVYSKKTDQAFTNRKIENILHSSNI